MKPIPTENPLPKQGGGFPKYFYLNDTLHKKVAIDVGAETLEAWSIPDEKLMIYSLIWAKKNKQRAFTLKETAALLNRSQWSLYRLLTDGDIEQPQYMKTDVRGWNDSGIGKYMFSEKHIKGIHDFLIERGGPGYPRKDGRRRTLNLPPWRLIKSWIDEDEVVYVMRNGQMVPTFLVDD